MVIVPMRLSVQACRRIFLLMFVGTVFGCASPPEAANETVYKRVHQDSAYPAFDPDVLSPDLRSRLDATESGEFVPIIVKLNSRADLDSVASFTSVTNKSEQRTVAISYLREFAFDSQQNLMQAARGLERDGLARDIRPLWIANAICLEVTREAVTYLS